MRFHPRVVFADYWSMRYGAYADALSPVMIEKLRIDKHTDRAAEHRSAESEELRQEVAQWGITIQKEAIRLGRADFVKNVFASFGEIDAKTIFALHLDASSQNLEH